ncbi:MAG: hypothetical protein K2M94_05665 [Paramuribaculum sp.]|nr:hypothetical protein [Paramuribaculum sp.]
MKRLLSVFLLGLSVSVLYGYAPVKTIAYHNCHAQALNVTNGCNLSIDSVLFTDEFTRVIGKLYGKPHTSAKINDIIISIDGTVCSATDIEGFDFQRWFQWEDSGIIPIEIDFEPLKASSSFVLTLEFPSQSMTWSINCKQDKK